MAFQRAGVDTAMRSDSGAEDHLQLTADHLSTSQPMTQFWQTHSTR